MGYDREVIREQLEHRSAEQLATLLVEWADDQVMTGLIVEAQELYHGLAAGLEFRPSAAQLEALGFPLRYQYNPKHIGYWLATDHEEQLAIRMVLWWAGTGQYQLRRWPNPQTQCSTIHATWSTEEDFVGLFHHFFS